MNLLLKVNLFKLTKLRRAKIVCDPLKLHLLIHVFFFVVFILVIVTSVLVSCTELGFVLQYFRI